jgi:glucose/arabinose dehydrogenase
MKTRRRIALAAFTGLAIAASTATSAQTPMWQQGRPKEMESSGLEPINALTKPLPANQIPVDRVKLPPGFKIAVWADNVENAREIVRGTKGTIFVGSRTAGKVYAIVDKGTTRQVKILATGLSQPNGVEFKDGALYVAESNRIWKMENIEDRLDNPPEPKLIFDKIPRADVPHHHWKPLRFGPDGKLYFSIGAPCNICNPPKGFASITRINADGSGFEVVARGLRNTLDWDWHPVTKELYFTNHGSDWMGDDKPDDILGIVSKGVPDFGFPFCEAGEPHPELGKGHRCSEFAAPTFLLGPHVAPIGTRFYTGSMFPAEYKNRLFIAQKGSWNRTKKVGYRVMMITLGGQNPKYEPFAEGWLENGKMWGRPSYLYQMPDGALLLSDDYNGCIYRVSYGG